MCKYYIHAWNVPMGLSLFSTPQAKLTLLISVIKAVKSNSLAGMDHITWEKANESC